MEDCKGMKTSRSKVHTVQYRFPFSLRIFNNVGVFLVSAAEISMSR